MHEPRKPPRRRRARAAAIATALLAVAATGCAPEPAPAPEVTATPEPAPPSPEEVRAARAADWVAGASTRELAAAVLMATVPTTDQAALATVMRETGLGGFIIMGANVPGSPDELAALTASLTVDPALPPLIGIDEEGGVVTRLPWDTLPGADTLRTLPPAATEAAFRARGELLRDSGVNVNFGVVADISADAASFIYPRTLGDRGTDASPRVRAAVTGERGTVASTLKHFPGHGATAADSHTAIPETALSLDSWRGNELLPFRSGVDAGAELVMFSHLIYSAVSPAPASLSPEWYRLVRDELGFTGVTVTDDLGMLRSSGVDEYQNPAATAVQALQAGADLALVVIGMDAAGAAALVDGVTAAAEAGTLPRARLDEAATRVITLRLELAEQHGDGSAVGDADAPSDTAQGRDTAAQPSGSTTPTHAEPGAEPR